VSDIWRHGTSGCLERQASVIPMEGLTYYLKQADKTEGKQFIPVHIAAALPIDESNRFMSGIQNMIQTTGVIGWRHTAHWLLS
jgi:hypothetical protein